MPEPLSAQDIAKEWKRFVHEDEAWWAGSVLEEIATTMVAMRTDLTTRLAAVERERDELRALVADTDAARARLQATLEYHYRKEADASPPRAWGIGELAALRDKISRPVTQESVPLSDDPDDYPVTEEAHDATE